MLDSLLDYLDENGLTENTLVVYTSDQGFYLGEHGWFDKRFIYDESFKTPLLVKVARASLNRDQPVTRWFRTWILPRPYWKQQAVAAPADMQGESLVPLFKGNEEDWDRDAVYYHYYEYPCSTYGKTPLWHCHPGI